ncbi:pesticin C-terminus-like muramidase [Archangium violaceum]|uniref:Pesticin n=1 Tax=Archangium violaceum Cb vi76 TaxID=1406225 RepID=A0A084SH79_9BACT|nr:pesticin C-terminus-like muramidase [Archangium violaceum]KFA87814.1 pesticin [Archangium violaceum Cb vi76]
MAGIERSSSSSSSQRSTQQSSRVSSNEATRNVRSELSQPDAATQQTRTSQGAGHTFRDGWDDAPVRANLNLRTADARQAQQLHQVQQTVAAEEVAEPGAEVAEPGTDIDWDFIAEQEGAARQDAYVPDPEGSQSGVTVGTGVDLGARDLADLQRLGLSEALQERLTPYLGLQQQEAVDFLEANPLQLTAEEVEELDQAVRDQAVDSLITRYNAEVTSRNAEDGGERVSFEELPAEMQTVIASVHFQYGTLSTETPNFFGQVVDQRWDDALGNLRDFGDDYPSRRGREADLLESGMSAAS